jgi:L-asparagine transporter-like permease
MRWLPIIIVALPIIAAVALRYSDKIFGELDDYFAYFAWGTVIAMIGIAVYLSYAFPSIAGGTRYDQPVPTSSDNTQAVNTDEVLFEAN